LADLKIAERARGFALNPRPNAIGIISHHVDSVLQTHRLPTQLQQIAEDLEHQLAERALISRAKNLLQSAQGISEDQAYALLRASSRKSRRKIGAVARQVIGATSQA
jgi:response regulator NasT